MTLNVVNYNNPGLGLQNFDQTIVIIYQYEYNHHHHHHLFHCKLKKWVFKNK